MTPTQLRAFACVVRLGSVKAAAGELRVSEAAVSMHVAQLRKELGDVLFTRTSSGLAFSPGGLRLASRAVEILGLQDRTVREVSQAGTGRRVLRIGSSSLFAEHAAPGLIELFAGRAKDLEVELSVRPRAEFPALLAARTVDVAIGPAPASPLEALSDLQFLRYEIVTVARPDHPLAKHPLSADQARQQSWCLGPAAAEPDGMVPEMLRRLAVPEQHQQIFQSHAAALEEVQRTDGVALALRFAVVGDLAARRLVTLEGPGLRAQGRWAAMALPKEHQTPAAAELLRFITTPRATQAMVRGAGVHLGRFKPAVHVTLWS
ncbi:LysR family transcriptional regulator [Nocardioides koreensis]|uniref:LysR family transcriptional regulator n=1 Tax=Nocardioides koreensis TaxID=433651 RepID=A0ABN2ZI76_9ACTN